MTRSIVKTIVFLILLTSILFGINSVLCFKEYNSRVIPTLKSQNDNSIDALFIGSSHVFSNINTGTIWDNSGIASFCLGGGEQPLWSSYFYLKEALKTQHPKCVILDVYRAIEDKEYSNASFAVFNNFYLPFDSKMEALSVSVPDESLSDYILEYPIYHSRYSDISKEDFTYQLNSEDLLNSKNSNIPNGSSYSQKALDENPDANITNEVLPLTAKTEQYLRMFIELCLEEKIDLLLVNSPCNVTDEEQAKFNRVGEIAQEYSVAYLDLNRDFDQTGMNFVGESSDLSEDGHHLNLEGTTKYSLFLGNYLSEHYGLPDRRDNPAYSSWQNNADRIRQSIETSKAEHAQND